MGNRSRGGKRKQGRALVGLPLRDHATQDKIQELLDEARKEREAKKESQND